MPGCHAYLQGSMVCAIEPLMSEAVLGCSSAAVVVPVLYWAERLDACPRDVCEAKSETHGVWLQGRVGAVCDEGYCLVTALRQDDDRCCSSAAAVALVCAWSSVPG